MNEMVERVAKALSANLEEGFPRFTQQSWDQLSMPAKAVAITRARVAIEAMRNPTDNMLDATGGECRKWAPGAWQAMIDEALK